MAWSIPVTIKIKNLNNEQGQSIDTALTTLTSGMIGFWDFNNLLQLEYTSPSLPQLSFEDIKRNVLHFIMDYNYLPTDRSGYVGVPIDYLAEAGGYYLGIVYNEKVAEPTWWQNFLSLRKTNAQKRRFLGILEFVNLSHWILDINSIEYENDAQILASELRNVFNVVINIRMGNISRTHERIWEDFNYNYDVFG